MFENFPYIIEDEAPSTFPSSNTIEKVVKFLLDGKTVGWYQGNGEIGPRALGNRSILFNPLIKNGKEIINKIKNRENYRPFGAVCLKEYAHLYFKMDNSDPFMLYTAEVLDKNLQTITHIDNTCRVQTLDKENPILRNLIEKFFESSGYPILLNTSLNVSGRPIAGSIGDAEELFFNSSLEVLVIGDNIYSK